MTAPERELACAAPAVPAESPPRPWRFDFNIYAEALAALPGRPLLAGTLNGERSDAEKLFAADLRARADSPLPKRIPGAGRGVPEREPQPRRTRGPMMHGEREDTAPDPADEAQRAANKALERAGAAAADLAELAGDDDEVVMPDGSGRDVQGRTRPLVTPPRPGLDDHAPAGSGDERREGPGRPCCDLHGRNCEPPGDLCCWDCTEAGHPQHADGQPCSSPDLSGNAVPDALDLLARPYAQPEDLPRLAPVEPPPAPGESAGPGQAPPGDLHGAAPARPDPTTMASPRGPVHQLDDTIPNLPRPVGPATPPAGTYAETANGDAPGQHDPYGLPGDMPVRWPLPEAPRPAQPSRGETDRPRGSDGPGPRHARDDRQPRRFPRRSVDRPDQQRQEAGNP